LNFSNLTFLSDLNAVSLGFKFQNGNYSQIYFLETQSTFCVKLLRIEGHF